MKITLDQAMGALAWAMWLLTAMILLLAATKLHRIGLFWGWW